MKKATISAAVLAATLSFNANAFWAPSEAVTACRAEHPEWQESFNRLNPTTLTDYQVCRAVAEENLTGIIGRNLYLITGDVVTYVPVLEIQGKSKDVATKVIEAAVVESLLAEEKAKLEEAIAELESAQKEIDDLEQALVDLGIDHEQVVEALEGKHADIVANLENEHAKALLAEVEAKKEALQQLNDKIAELSEAETELANAEAQVASLEGQLADLETKYDNKSYTVTVNGVDHVVSADTTFTVDVEHNVSVNINGVAVDTHDFTADGDFNLTVGVNADGEITIDGLHESAFGTVELEDGVNQSHVDAVQGQLDLANIQINTMQGKIDELKADLDAAVAKLTFNGVDYANAQAAYTAGANDTAAAVAYAFNQHFGKDVSGISTAAKIALVASEAVKDAIAAGEEALEDVNAVVNLSGLQGLEEIYGEHNVVTDHGKNAASSVAHAYANNMVTWTISDLGYDNVVTTSTGAWASIADVIEEAYDLGFDRGYDSGYADGYVDGYKDGFADGVASVK